MNKDYKSIKIVDIERMKGIEHDETKNLDFALPQWYNSIRQKAIGELRDFDIARCIRQDVYLDFIISEAIERLIKNPLIGDFYDGEVLIMLSNIDKSFWESNNQLIGRVKELIEVLGTTDAIPQDYIWFSEKEEAEYLNAIKNLKAKIV